MIEFGKLQPQAIDEERSILSSILVDKNTFTICHTELNHEDFYLESHQEIYKAASSLFSRGVNIDLFTVREELKKLGSFDLVGGSYAIKEILESDGVSRNVVDYIQIVKDKSVRRQIIQTCTLSVQNAFSDEIDSNEILNEIDSSSLKIKSSVGGGSEINKEEVIFETVREMTNPPKGGIVGIEITDIPELNKKLNGGQGGELIIIAARPSMGKCLGEGTKVVMFDGRMKKVEDVVVGDVLMGDDSTPRNVLSTTSGIDQMYLVKQNKGINYRVNSQHILSLKKSREDGRLNRGHVIDIQLNEYLSKSNKFKNNYKGYKVGVEFLETKTKIEPYFLGLWLGDGNKRSVNIHTEDEEVKTYLNEYAERLGKSVKNYGHDGACMNLVITGRAGEGNSLQKTLRSENLISNKHIPENYLCNSKRLRLELLAGLIDSDGHYDAQCNGYEITQTRESLSIDIKRLCDSLGFRTSLIPKKATIKSIGYESLVYRVRVFGNVNMIPVRIKRKKAKAWTCNRTWTNTGVVIEKDKVDKYYGFLTDGNHRFLLEDYTVTHNSMLANASVSRFSELGKRGVMWGLEMRSKENLKRFISAKCDISFSDISRGRLDVSDVQMMDKIEKATDLWKNGTVQFIERSGVNAMDVRSKLFALKNRGGLDYAIIDHGGLLNHDLDRSLNESSRIGLSTKLLKQTAKELDIPIILLWQLNRESETTGNKIPSLKNLRGSGNIEEDADKVLFIHRPEYYEGDGNTFTGEAIIKIDKNRNGECGVVDVTFNPDRARFEAVDTNSGFSNDLTTKQKHEFNNAGMTENRQSANDDIPF